MTARSGMLLSVLFCIVLLCTAGCTGGDDAGTNTGHTLQPVATSTPKATTGTASTATTAVPARTATAATTAAAATQRPGSVPGTLLVDATASGAAVYVDGQFEGLYRDGGRVEVSVDEGTHAVKVTRTGYLDYAEDVYVRAGATVVVNADMIQKSGYISVRSYPVHDAVIYLDGVRKGLTDEDDPVMLTVSPGTYVLKLTKSGYEDFVQTVTVNPDSTYRITAQMDPVSVYTRSYIAFNSTPTGADVYIDGTYRGKTVYQAYFNVTVTGGTHTVMLHRDGYQSYTKKVTVSSNSYVIVSAQLTTL